MKVKKVGKVNFSAQWISALPHMDITDLNSQRQCVLSKREVSIIAFAEF